MRRDGFLKVRFASYGECENRNRNDSNINSDFIYCGLMIRDTGQRLCVGMV